jgi:transposase-like protein
VQTVLQELLEAEMTEAFGAERPSRRRGGSATEPATTPARWSPGVGKLELCVPRGRHGRFSTELFERCQRSEKTLVAALAEIYVQGVSTRKVRAITARLAPSADLGGRRGAARSAATAPRPRRSARSTRGSTRSWRSSRAGGWTKLARI